MARDVSPKTGVRVISLSKHLSSPEVKALLNELVVDVSTACGLKAGDKFHFRGCKHLGKYPNLQG